MSTETPKINVYRSNGSDGYSAGTYGATITWSDGSVHAVGGWHCADHAREDAQRVIRTVDPA